MRAPDYRSLPEYYYGKRSYGIRIATCEADPSVQFELTFKTPAEVWTWNTCRVHRTNQGIHTGQNSKTKNRNLNLARLISIIHFLILSIVPM